MVGPCAEHGGWNAPCSEASEQVGKQALAHRASKGMKFMKYGRLGSFRQTVMFATAATALGCSAQISDSESFQSREKSSVSYEVARCGDLESGERLANRAQIILDGHTVRGYVNTTIPPGKSATTEPGDYRFSFTANKACWMERRDDHREFEFAGAGSFVERLKLQTDGIVRFEWRGGGSAVKGNCGASNEARLKSLFETQPEKGARVCWPDTPSRE